MVKLQLATVPNLTGYVHIQTNPKLSYSAAATVENALRMSSVPLISGTRLILETGVIQIFKTLAPDFDAKRVCIKVPATWEGMQACRTLESKGVSTLATTMFCMEQAALASDAQCTYIAPYVNELRVHFEAG